jgi:DNA-binding Lrp family transcriptional regulator
VRELDGQESTIVRALIKNPRISDNKLGEEMGIPVRTVNRKRKRLESEGIISYMTHVNMLPSGTGHFQVQHLFIIRFRLGITYSQIEREVRNEPNVITIFTELIFESYIAEIDGHLALVMVVEGQSEADIVERFQAYIIPSLQKNHGKDSIEEVSTIRLLEPIRMLKNYLPLVNMKDGRLKKEWRMESIYLGDGKRSSAEARAGGVAGNRRDGLRLGPHPNRHQHHGQS